MKNPSRNLNNATTWALSVFDSDMTATQKLICLYLRTHMNDYRDVAWPSKSRIAKRCSLGVRSVQNNMKLICEQGYLMENGYSSLGTIRYEIRTPALDAPPHLNTPPPAPDAPELTKELTNKHIKGKPLIVIPDNINPEAWSEWMEQRKQLKKKMTPATISRQQKMLGKYDHKTQKAIINQSITAGWAGLFELKNEKRVDRKTNSTRHRSLQDDLNDTSWA